MTANLRKKTATFDPQLGVLVAACETTSKRVRAKLREPYRWCFCELCGKSTEFATAIEAKAVFKRLRRGSAKAVPLSDEVRAEAQQMANNLVSIYDRALAGDFGPEAAGQMVAELCDVREMRGDLSVESFRDQVERRALMVAWARRGDVFNALRLPNQPDGAPKPSKFYCEGHNPRRSAEARRAYQRDRRFAAEYEELMSIIWNQRAGTLPRWDLEAHAYVRREAFRLLQAMKVRTALIGELQDQGVTCQAEIARRLGVSRQAVSKIIKRSRVGHAGDDGRKP
ncbi:putative uncharacterized protein [Burkholderiales bacterium GJ-E10]|nr:putative uncharacterized protein [Burkholderiales bacterium GJ-E10]